MEYNDRRCGELLYRHSITAELELIHADQYRKEQGTRANIRRLASRHCVIALCRSPSPASASDPATFARLLRLDRSHSTLYRISSLDYIHIGGR